jgi:golgi phosphoprotein 3
METSVTKQFIILALHPDRGRIMIMRNHFRYALIGSLLMDFLLKGEISMSHRRLIPSFRKNGERIHDMIAVMMDEKSNPHRVSYWVRRLSLRSNLVYRETVSQMASRGILSQEKRYFLNLIPYNRYKLVDRRYREQIIDSLRDVLFHGKEATGIQSMLIGLLKASSAHSILAREKSEKPLLRKLCRNFSTDNEMATEIDRAIREVQAAIIASVTAATAASHASH